MDNQVDSLLVLMLVDKIPEFRTADKLVKILSRRFGIFDFLDKILPLIEKKLLKQTIIDQIGHYSITSTGKQYLSSHEMWLKENLEIFYPKEKEFIDHIINSDF